jgi:hypothetical protein
MLIIELLDKVSEFLVVSKIKLYIRRSLCHFTGDFLFRLTTNVIFNLLLFNLSNSVMQIDLFAIFFGLINEDFIL